MRLFFASLNLELKRNFFSRWFIILALVMVLIIAGIAGVYNAEDSALEINVGVVYDSGNDYAQAVFDRLTKLEVASFYHLENVPEEELERLVSIGEYESVYFLGPELESSIAKGFLRDTIPSIISPTSMLSTLIDEWVFSSILIQSTPDISLFEIERILKVPRSEVKEELEEKFRWYEENYSYVEAVSNWEGGVAQTTENTRLGWVRIYHGVISLIILLLFASNLASLINRLGYVDQGLSRGQRPVFRLASLASSIISGLAFGAIGLVTLKIVDAPILRPLQFEFAALLIYVLFLAVIINILGTLLSTSDGIFSGTIFIFLAVLFLGGVLFKPLEISIWLDKVARFFPTYYYNEAVVDLSFLPLIYLAAVSAVLLVIGLGISMLPVKREK